MAKHLLVYFLLRPILRIFHLPVYCILDNGSFSSDNFFALERNPIALVEIYEGFNQYHRAGWSSDDAVGDRPGGSSG
jgi:hypothetical protein